MATVGERPFSDLIKNLLIYANMHKLGSQFLSFSSGKCNSAVMRETTEL
jgi:hypothetical protein